MPEYVEKGKFPENKTDDCETIKHEKADEIEKRNETEDIIDSGDDFKDELEKSIQEEIDEGSKILEAISAFLLVGIIALLGIVILFLVRKIDIISLIPKNKPQTASVSAESGEIIVPDLIGMDEGKAQSVLSPLMLGLKSQLVPSSLPYGEIVGQDPMPGQVAEEHSTVYVSISQGPSTLTVPYNLKGLTANEAVSTLEEYGATNISTVKTYQQGEFGTVLSVSPGEGSTVASDGDIKLEISAGTKQSASPSNYIGMKEKDAIVQATEDRLVPIIRYAYSNCAEPGTIIRQSVDKNAPVMSGVTIELYSATNSEPAIRETKSVKLGMPETATGAAFRIVAEETTDTGFAEILLTEDDSAPQFPYEIDVPLVGGMRSCVVRYFEKNEEGKYIPRANWPIGG